MKEIKKNMRKNERGSITLFVLVTMMLISAILLLSYANHANKISSQKKQIEEIQRQYHTEEDIEEVYEQVKNSMP